MANQQNMNSASHGQAQAMAAPAGDWLWVKLMDFCKKRGYAPAEYNDLFAIVKEARAAQAGRRCLTCNDQGAVGNILTAEPCPDCTQKAAPAAVAGLKKWAPEEVEDGERGIRWVTNEGIHGRPTDHDVREYLNRTPTAKGCLCDECKVFYAAAPTTQPAPQQEGK